MSDNLGLQDCLLSCVRALQSLSVLVTFSSMASCSSPFTAGWLWFCGYAGVTT